MLQVSLMLIIGTNIDYCVEHNQERPMTDSAV